MGFPALFDFFGSESDPIGRRLYDVAKREENLPFYEALEATAVDGIRREVRNESGDFGITFDNVISRVGDLVVVEATDVTREIEAEAQQRLARSAQDAITEHMLEAMIMVDLQRHTVLTNQQCEDFFGDFDWLRAFLDSGKPFDELQLGFPIDDPEGQLNSCLEVWQHVTRTGESFYGVLELPTLRGPRVFQVVSSRWEHEGEILGIIDIKTDITKAVAAQRELEVKKQQVASLGLVKQFAQGVAHDSGNVAQVVQGYAQLLHDNPSDEVRLAAIEGLNSVAERSVRLAHDISEIARIGEVPETPIDLTVFIHSHLPVLHKTVGDKVRLTLESSGDPLVMANEAQLRSILDNLCENAARAMNYRGSVELCLSTTDEKVILQVRDNGPGLPAELDGHLFEPFSSSAASRATGGTGLGLYLVREYLRSLGGDVAVVTSSAGTTFTLSFPVVRADDTRAEQK